MDIVLVVGVAVVGWGAERTGMGRMGGEGDDGRTCGDGVGREGSDGTGRTFGRGLGLAAAAVAGTFVRCVMAKRERKKERESALDGTGRRAGFGTR